MPKPQHVLVFRLSSLGDVAMTVPVLQLLLQQHPELQVTMVSVPFVQPLFENIERLHFVAAEVKGKHKGITGLFRLYKEIKQRFEVNAIADLHGSLRTKILRQFFSSSKMIVAVIDKGRKEKEELTRQNDKILKPLISTFQRYANVFAELGFSIEWNTAKGLLPKPEEGALTAFPRAAGAKVVGIAPFARFDEKTYPLVMMKEVVRMLDCTKTIMIYLFGDETDHQHLMRWDKEFKNVKSMADRGSLNNQLNTLAHLDVMVSMDSANMHLASMYGVPVVSIWGGTHPYLGFYGWGQNLENALQIDLPCRPSSVYGNKKCKNNMACMNGIAPITIYEKVMSLLK